MLKIKVVHEMGKTETRGKGVGKIRNVKACELFQTNIMNKSVEITGTGIGTVVRMTRRRRLPLSIGSTFIQSSTLTLIHIRLKLLRKKQRLACQEELN